MHFAPVVPLQWHSRGGMKRWQNWPALGWPEVAAACSAAAVPAYPCARLLSFSTFPLPLSASHVCSACNACYCERYSGSGHRAALPSCRQSTSRTVDRVFWVWQPAAERGGKYGEGGADVSCERKALARQPRMSRRGAGMANYGLSRPQPRCGVQLPLPPPAAAAACTARLLQTICLSPSSPAQRLLRVHGEVHGRRGQVRGRASRADQLRHGSGELGPESAGEGACLQLCAP